MRVLMGKALVWLSDDLVVRKAKAEGGF